MSESRPLIDASSFTVGYPSAPVDWVSIFANKNPVELEVGSGKGLFLANAANANPDRNYLGVELARKYALKAAERIAKRGLTNVRVLPGDARRFLHEFVPAGSLEAVHLYFPDPWWKKRHKKRRVFCEPFVDDVASALRPGGDFFFSSDVEEYFGVMQAIMSVREEFTPQPVQDPKAPEHDLDYLTNFERKYRIEGRPIFRAHYRRLAKSGDREAADG
jgi:tRNA (guanine-N7-)-methyltransferase